jgi:hypothetical protein
VKLLFDVHVARATVAALRKIAPHLQARHIAHWRDGALLHADDEQILSACRAEKRVFVTYDMASIPDLLHRWAAEERAHSGVIFADKNSVRPNSPGEVASAVAALAKEVGNADTTNLVRFLRPAR